MTYPKNVANPSHSADHRDDSDADTPEPITAVGVWADASTATPKLAKLPALFISHGAPSLAIEQSATTSALARIGQNLPVPRAIVIMSAHWQSTQLEISSNPQPKTWHDFSGFAPELYEIQYPTAGFPTLAESLAQQLSIRGISCSINPMRACDHGVWAPLIHLYPEADLCDCTNLFPQHYDSIACYQFGCSASTASQ